ncbi:MAG: hypothetical protein Q9222_003768 [Ikaeria aurantiellina]
MTEESNDRCVLVEGVKTPNVFAPMDMNEAPQPAAFFRLPLELRRMIYRQALKITTPKRSTLEKHVYFGNIKDLRIHQPCCLPLICRQIQGEVADFLHRAPVFMRITPQGIVLDSHDRAVAFALGMHRDLSTIKCLNVEIWPPGPDRPVDLLYIWYHMRRLRDRLKRSSKVPKINIRFPDNKRAAWTSRCVETDYLPIPQPYRFSGSSFDRSITDIKCILNLLATLSNVTDANIRPPWPFFTRHIGGKRYIRTLIARMEGRKPPATDVTYIETLNFDEVALDLKRRTARLFQKGIERLTCNGMYKMSQDDWDYLTQRPPYLETLDSFKWIDFEGKWHFVWPAGPQNKDWTERPRREKRLGDRCIVLVASDEHWESIQLAEREAEERRQRRLRKGPSSVYRMTPVESSDSNEDDKYVWL